MLFFYNMLFFPGLLFFLPGLIYKLIRRPGYKKTFSERFAIFSEEQKNLLRSVKKPVWVHAVSVGETMVALALIKKWKEKNPSAKFVLSTTTTTGQELARSKAPKDVPVFFCPLDFILFVRRTLRLVNPSMLVILETEIWPNLISEARKYGKVVLVNARISDKSVKGYLKFKSFFGPLLSNFDLICAQSENDASRFLSIEQNLNVKVSGNIKFDQEISSKMADIDLSGLFGNENFTLLLAASTHPREEKLIAETYLKLKNDFQNLKLVIVPRHSERGTEIASILDSLKIPFHRRSQKTSSEEGGLDCLLADTTGELLTFIKKSDIVIMGKSLAGHDEGHNLIEPALLAKPVVTGSVITNFRFVLNALLEKNAVFTVDSDDKLEGVLRQLLENPSLRMESGKRAKEAISVHKGAADRTVELIEKSF